MRDLTRRECLKLTAMTAAAVSGRIPASGELIGTTAPTASTENQGRRFCFLHTYEATGRYWRGLEKAGLVRPGVGVRLVNSPFGSDDRRFNQTACLGGELHRILTERRCPFVIDRVAGGAPYLDYPFDQAVVASYAKLLGPAFLGGQVHEAVCNVHNDWGRLTKADPKLATEPVRPEDLASYFSWDNAAKWLEYGALKDYAGRRHPQTPQAWWDEVRWAAQRQGGRFGNCWSYAEGSAHGQLGWHALYKFGARYAMAEVGVWASTHSPFFIASLRGAARAAGKPWGVFFAPWGPGGCTSFIPEADWSWQCPRKHLDDSGWPVGPNLGASTALQRRIFFHAYLAGARVLYEEWGAECNLTDWDAGTLSSYGRVTHDLLDFMEQCPDVGEPYTPLALVLDATIPPPHPAQWDAIRVGLYQYGRQDAANAKRPGSGEAETACYGPCVVPELFDIVPSDAPEAVLEGYRQRIHIVPDESAPACVDRIVAACRELSPFNRATHMPTQINRRGSDGAWILAMYNPWGAKRGDVEKSGSILDDGCTQHDAMEVKFPIKSVRPLHAWPASSTVSLREGKLEVAVGPGGTIILEVVPGKAGR